MSVARTRATHLLTHYMRHAWTSAGVQWDSDHDAEIASIFDAISAMVDDAIETHRATEPHIYADGSTH